MIDLGKGVSVDFLKHPYVFGIDGWDPIRIQKGKGRVTGVSLEQLKLIVKTVEGSDYGQKPNNGDAVKAASRKTRADGVRSTKSRKDDGYSTKQKSGLQRVVNALDDE